MLQLTLVRHAKSSWDDVGLSDHERPLSARGRRDAPRIFKRFAELGSGLDAIVSSDAVRALSTAKLLAAALSIDTDEIRVERRLYLASPTEIFELVRELDDRLARVALVGHNPGFTDAVNIAVTETHIDNLPTSALAVIAFDCAHWAHAAPEGGRLSYFDYPKNRAAPLTWD